MSQQTKRSATEAFDKDHTASAVSKKRTRRRTKHKDSTPVALPNGIEQDSAPSPEATAIVLNGKSGQSVSDLHEQSQHVPDTNKEGRDGSRHTRNHKNNSLDSGNKTSVELQSIERNAHDGVKNQSTEDKKPAKKSRVGRRKDGSQSYPKGGWIDLAVGGSFLDQDPVLSQDEQYFLLPTKSHIHVYSAKTSLLVRSLFITQADSVTSCITCPSDPEEVLVSTYRGTITKYNWATGRKLQKWKTTSGLLRIYGLPASNSDDTGSSILAINQRPGGERDISYFCLPVSLDMPVKEVVLRSKQRIASTLVTLEGGKLLVGFGGDKVMLGFSQDLESGGCTWRDVNVPGMIVSVDARGQAASINTTKTESAVDVVVGLQDGAIIILDDILTWLMQKEKATKGIDRISRRLHWHRGAVSAVKWSRDGNYLISGGQETVLVIWQLDTNQQQFLPHLSSSIYNIVVSSSGSSYTLRLADNSVMMLSTNDLAPKANIRGISVSKELGRNAVAALNPHQPDQLLLATPSDLSLSSPSTLTTLQTIDLATSHEVSRQALVRNLTTTVNVGPNGQRILGPNVVQLKTSHDGLWLATVDEWTPPDTDCEPLDLDSYDSMSAGKTEIFLKFWSFNKETKMWEMNTKVEGPHSATPHSILQLASSPVRDEFASLGKDRYLRIWHPMLRQRNGLPVKNKTGESLYTWTCVHEQQPDPMPAELESTIQATSAALAYSEDGTAIAISFCFKDRPRGLHFFSDITLSVELSYSHVDLCPPGKAEMAFSGNRLLILADKFLIWDAVDEELDICITLKEDFVQGNGRFLAVNKSDRTYAVALNPPDVRTAATVAIFNANRPGTVIHGFKIDGHVKALLAAKAGPGYIVVDGEARIRRLRPGSSAMTVWKSSVGETDDAMKTLNDVFGASSKSDGEDTMRGLNNVSGENPKNDGEDAMPAVRSVGQRSRTLEDILEENATSSKPALPSELFEQVARLYMKDIHT